MVLVFIFCFFFSGVLGLGSGVCLPFDYISRGYAMLICWMDRSAPVLCCTSTIDRCTVIPLFFCSLGAARGFDHVLFYL